MISGINIFFPGGGGETKLIRMKTLLDTKKSEICQLQRALALNHYFLNNFHLIKLTRPHSTLGYEPKVLSASFRIRINLVQKKKKFSPRLVFHIKLIMQS